MAGALSLAETIIRVARDRGMARIYIRGLAQKAQLIVETSPREALDLCLEALAAADEQRYRLSSSLAREGLLLDILPLQGRAMRLAHQLGERELFVELIENCRLQALPTAETPQQPTGSRADSYFELTLGSRTFVAVGGRSRLGEVARQTGQVADIEIVNLEDLIAAVDEEAVWWSCWLAQRALHWAIVGTHGVKATGCDDLGDDHQLFLAVEAVRAATATSSARPDRDQAVRTTPFTDSWAGEEALMRALSNVMLPAPLRDMIADRAAQRWAGSDRPVRLLIAVPPELSAVPIGLLPVTDDSPSLRLMEGAIHQWVPPARLFSQLARRPAPPAPPYPISLAILNPTADERIPHSSSPPPGSEWLMSGADSAPPTASAVILKLQQLGRSAPGVVYFAGHFDSGSDGILSSGPRLADGTLTARHVYTSQGQPDEIVFPVRVQLSACSSMSSTSMRSVDWTGFAGAVLAAGASCVVATAWDLLDTAFTTQVDHQIAQMLEQSNDPAAGLRRIQTEYLALWRTAQGTSAEPPIVWAAYQFIGT